MDAVERSAALRRRASIVPLVAYLVAVVLGLAFGAADQQLGTLTAELGPWTSTASQMSAPWLILPFLVGTTQERPRRAAVLGLVVTASALVGYFAMTYSPVEIHPWSFDRFTSGFVAVTTSGYNPMYILGGLVTGPLFGLLGQRWRVQRSWVSAAIVAGVLCLEPLARWTSGSLMEPGVVWAVEVASGVVVATLFAYALTRLRRVRAPVPAQEPLSSD
jgi:uncharacterized membrane protein (UPF0136 family)